MSGIRVSIVLPGATTAELLAAAVVAEHVNIGALWLGDPLGDAPNSADSYLTAAAGAVVARTRDLRVGLLLDLRHDQQVVRLAEDVGVLDQASGGRIELGFVAAPGTDGVAVDRAGRLLRAWSAWELPGSGELVAVIPGPVQPAVPVVVVGDEHAARELNGGRVVFGAVEPTGALVPPRAVRHIDLGAELGDGGVVGWLEEAGAIERVDELRARAAESGAYELLLSAPALTDRDLRAIGTVLVPALRASARDAHAAAYDAWVWFTQKTELHAPPQRAR